MTLRMTTDKLPLALCVATLFFFVAIMGTRPLISLLAIEMGLDLAEVGALTAVFSVLPLFGATFAGAWMDRHGAKITLIIGALVTALGLALPVLLQDRLGLYISQLISGSGFTLFTISGQRLASKFGSNPLQRQKSINTFSFMVSLGSFLGPTSLGALSEALGLRLAILSMVIPLLIVLICVIAGEDTEHHVAEGQAEAFSVNPLHSLGYHPMMLRAFLISTFVLLARDSFMAFFPLHGAAQGLSATTIGVIVGLHNLGSLISRLGLMPVLALAGRNKTVLGSLLGAGLLCILLPFSTEVPSMSLVAIGIGIGLGVGQPLSISLAAQLAPPRHMGEVLGARLTFNRLTQVVAPLSFGIVSAQLGVAGVFWLTGVLMVMGLPILRIPDSTVE